MCAHGAYELMTASGDAEVTLFATGSETEIAHGAPRRRRGGRPPDPRRLRALLRAVRRAERRNTAAIIGASPVRVAIEAGVRQGWDRLIGDDGIFIGMTGFGASAPYKQLYAISASHRKQAAQAALDRLAAHA